MIDPQWRGRGHTAVVVVVVRRADEPFASRHVGT